MDSKDWLLLLGGAALGFVLNVVANFTTAPIGTAIGKLWIRYIERNKQRAKSAYVKISELRSGKRDKQIYAIESVGFIVSYLIMCATLVIIGFIEKESVDNSDLCFVASTLPGLLAWHRFVSTSLTLNRITNFEQYKSDLSGRWPDIISTESS
jgi:hypothetical protein